MHWEGNDWSGEHVGDRIHRYAFEMVTCPKCNALPGEVCTKKAQRIEYRHPYNRNFVHAKRFYVARNELMRTLTEEDERQTG